MGKTGRLYPPEFKEEAIRLVHSCEEKYPVAKVACDLDVSAETLHKWVKQADVDAGVAESFVSTLERELIHRQSWLNRQISWERKARSATSCGRPRRHPARGDPHCCKRPRLESLGGGRGRHLTDPQASWPSAKTPEDAARLPKAYDFPRCREALRKRGITPRIARRGIESSEKLGRYLELA